jgi:hypothetical protein
MSAIAYAQCRIIGWFTGSGASEGFPVPPVGRPTRALTSALRVSEAVTLSS